VLLKNLGKYEIIEWLGGGRFGDVFLARDTIIDKDFALKVSRMRREEVAMLKDEARLLASLSHPNIVRFYNIDFIENKFVLVMEYVKGNDLRDVITEGGTGIEYSLKIIKQITDALVYAHGNNVLHRDLKPENILITDEETASRVKITDFGLAKFIRSGSISASSAGTPIYMAPEAWAGSFSEKSDIWSLGIIFYELLTGIPPFLNDSLEGLKKKIEKNKFITPSVLRHAIPEAIENIVLSMLAVNPKSRPNAQEIMTQITRTDDAVRATAKVQVPRKQAEDLELTPVQEEIIAVLEQSILVLGQAGCGKTTTLTYAATTLVGRGIPANRLLICAFTNKAANDICERLQKTAPLSRHDLWLGTFHTLGFRILRRDAERLDISENFVIKQPKDILAEMRIDVGKHRINAVMKLIETLKAKGISPDTFKPQNAWERSCHKIYVDYQTYKREKDILDYDDLILYAIQLLEENDDLRQYYRGLFDYIFVDELQDINPAQYRLVNLIYSRRIFFTGDEDQAIYSWRGAERELIYRAPKDYPDMRIFHLSKSFRLAQGIIDIANNLMRREATVLPGAHTGEVFVYAAKSEKDEADYAAREIKNICKEDFHYRDIVILCRMNYLARVYEEALAKALIPRALIGGSSFYERAEAKPIIEYLSLLGEMTSGKEDQSTFIARAANLFKIPKKNLRRADAIYEHHFCNIKQLQLHRIIDDIIDLTGMQDESIDELNYLSRTYAAGDILSFLNEIRLIQELDLVNWKKDVVKIMTIHSAKGLEFPVVFVVDLVEDIFPLTRKISSQKEVEEERRLCYVALTRAQKKLYLLYPKWRSGRYQHPSRFLVDMLKMDT
jgi:DNA helicase-2/ATP-dependent DNA helicase PcrA